MQTIIRAAIAGAAAAIIATYAVRGIDKAAKKIKQACEEKAAEKEAVLAAE